MQKADLKENSPITTEYRTKPLRNALLASEDISNVLKGKDLSQKEIQAKMVEYDEEFKNILEEENAETYIKRCTDLMMKSSQLIHLMMVMEELLECYCKQCLQEEA